MNAFNGMTKEQLVAVVQTLAKQTALTVHQVIDLYLAFMRGRVDRKEISKDNLKNVSRDLDRFAGVHGPTLVRDATVRQVIDLYLAFMRGRVERKELSKDDFKNVARDLERLARVHGATLVRDAAQNHLTNFNCGNPSWRSVEYVKLMRFGSRPLRRALYFLRRTGMRVAEMRDLTWANVPRLMGLDASTARFLRNLRRQWERVQNCNCPHCVGQRIDRVFTNSAGGAWDRHMFARHLRRTAQRLGMDGAGENVVAYGLRHLFTVTGIEGGAV